MSAQPVRMYDSYGHPVTMIELANGKYVMATKEAAYAATAFESLTITNAAAVSLTAGTYGTANRAYVTVESNNVRVRWDGTAPTTAVGHLISANGSIELIGAADIADFKAIATGANATISVTYSAEA